jgi:hypothetical protein
MPGRVFRSEFWTPVVVTFCVLVMLGFAVLAFSVRSFIHEEHRLNAEQAQLKKETAETCRSERLLHDVLVGIALNQPNIDPRVLHVLETTLSQLPERCR